MRVWVYVEGPSDKGALGELWAGWESKLQAKGHRFEVIPLFGKGRFLKNIGPLAAEKLAYSPSDMVIGLPDLYPNAPYANSALRHGDITELVQVQTESVAGALKRNHGLRGTDLRAKMVRFFPSAFKYEMEMLLLAAKDQLRDVIGTSDQLGGWRTPVEEQDQLRPPKKIVEGLFQAKAPTRRAYRATRDAPEVLRRVRKITDLLFMEDGSENCPVFKTVLDWIGEKTGIPAYEWSPP